MDNIGGRIRDLRQEKKLTINDLAKQSGISGAYISKVERGLTIPSLDSLRKICQAMEVPTFHLLIEEPEEDAVLKLSQRKNLVFEDLGLKYSIIAHGKEKSMNVNIVHLAVNGRSSDEPLSHKGEECINVIQGKIQLELNGKILYLEKDDSIYFDSAIPHRIINLGSEEAIFNHVVSPPQW